MSKKLIPLAKLKRDNCAIVREIKINNQEDLNKLYDMGLIEGTAVQIIKKSPFGDPIVLKLRGYELCFRKKDLSDIFVEELICELP